MILTFTSDSQTVTLRISMNNFTSVTSILTNSCLLYPVTNVLRQFQHPSQKWLLRNIWLRKIIHVPYKYLVSQSK